MLEPEKKTPYLSWLQTQYSDATSRYALGGTQHGLATDRQSTDTPYPPVGYDNRPFHSEQRIRLTMTERNDYISVTRKNCISNDNEGRMIERNFLRYKERFWSRYEIILSMGQLEKACAAAEEDDDPDDITDIFRIEGKLFDYKTPLCKAFNDFNYLFKIDKDLFTFDVQGIGTYKEYELNNHVTRDLKEPYSNIDGFCNGGELPGMVRVGNMTYFQDRKWYDELADGKLKEETLMHKEKVEESWGNATPGINAHEVTPFTRLESYGQRPYANCKTEKAHDPYLEINNIFGRNYDTSNADNTQDYQGHVECRDDPTLCKIRRFEMMKYSFNADEEYIAIKESEYLNHSKDLDAYR
ncbi:hypothetical protein Tco_0144495 [Tanacetum coccineum]